MGKGGGITKSLGTLIDVVVVLGVVVLNSITFGFVTLGSIVVLVLGYTQLDPELLRVG